jgi:quercetin dioxygenase-like cupin family protein
MDGPQHIWFGGNLMSLLHTDGWTLLETHMRPGHAPPLHVHHSEDEAFYVLDGSMLFKRGEEAFDLGPGDSVVVQRGVAHAFRVGTSGAKALQVATGTALADFIREVGEPAPSPTLPTDVRVDPDAIARAAERHDMTVVGPALNMTTN